LLVRVVLVPVELIELLEKIIIEPSPFSNNKNLQNLLLLIAIHVDKGKVVNYINKLNYDDGEIPKIATEHGLFEEALMIYKKYNQHAMAINVLVKHIVSIDHGLNYAIKDNRPKVQSGLAKAQLDGLQIKDSIGELCLFTIIWMPNRYVLQTLMLKLKICPILWR
jgi:clathrin heavy chain